MEKKYQTIYILSFVIVAGFILLLLYTPLGGGLHKSTTIYKVENTSVNFGGKIANAPRIKASQPYIKSEDEIKSSSDYPKYSQSIASAKVSQAQNSGNFDYNVAGKNDNELQNRGDGIGTTNTGVYAMRKSSDTEVNSTVGGTANSPFSAEAGNIGPVMQKVSNDEVENTGPDPGGDGNNIIIPVGDGLPILLIMTILYLFVIKKRTKILLNDFPKRLLKH